MLEQTAQIAHRSYLSPDRIVEFQPKAGFQGRLQLHHGQTVQVQILGQPVARSHSLSGAPNWRNTSTSWSEGTSAATLPPASDCCAQLCTCRRKTLPVEVRGNSGCGQRSQ